MKFAEGQEPTWTEGWEMNSDLYGRAVYVFAQRWAERMETRMSAESVSVAEIADETSHAVNMDDAGGLTGFQYGCAVSILSEVWEYGEELRQWHNQRWQIGDEGDHANDDGTVLNPAVLQIEAASYQPEGLPEKP